MSTRYILVPVDFSDHSLHALQIASGLAADQGAALALLHIWTTQLAFNESSPQAVVLAAQEEAARKRLEELQPARWGVEIDHYLSAGAPADEIIRFTETHETDVVVMGTRGRVDSTRSIVGSIAEAVMHRAACPVVTCTLPRESNLRAVTLPADGCDGASSRRSREEPERLA